MAAAIETHTALPDRPAARLSNTSATSPGIATVTRYVFAWLPGPIETWHLLPSLPVYFEVNVMQFVCTAIVAAASVPSVTRTAANTLAPCCSAAAMIVIRSYLRFFTGPKICAPWFTPPTNTSELTGPHEALPTAASTLDGTPLSGRFFGGTTCT